MSAPATEVLGEGAALLLGMLAPAAGAAAGAALVVGWLTHRFGVGDPAPVLVARAAAVVAVLAWFAARWLAEGAAWTRGLWSALPAIGRGTGAL